MVIILLTRLIYVQMYIIKSVLAGARVILFKLHIKFGHNCAFFAYVQCAKREMGRSFRKYTAINNDPIATLHFNATAASIVYAFSISVRAACSELHTDLWPLQRFKYPL